MALAASLRVASIASSLPNVTAKARDSLRTKRSVLEVELGFEFLPTRRHGGLALSAQTVAQALEDGQLLGAVVHFRQGDDQPRGHVAGKPDPTDGERQNVRQLRVARQGQARGPSSGQSPSIATSPSAARLWSLASSECVSNPATVSHRFSTAVFCIADAEIEPHDRGSRRPASRANSATAASEGSPASQRNCVRHATT